MFIRMLVLLICWVPLQAREYTYNLGIVAIFQNEAPYFKEWIEYYRLQGVDHFWLYNNESQDNYLEVLQPYVDEGLVEVIDWPTAPFFNFNQCQMTCYRECLNNVKGVAKWLAVIDCDEFIITVNGQTISEYLKKYEKYAGIKINWQMYGTSFQPFIPSDKTMVETLVLRAEWDYVENELMKVIVRPERIYRLNLHSAVGKKDFSMIHPGKKIKKTPNIRVDEIRINHYWTRAEDFFFNEKIPRAERIRYSSYPPERVEKIQFNLNQIEDRIMDRYVPELRQRLGLELD